MQILEDPIAEADLTLENILPMRKIKNLDKFVEEIKKVKH